MATKLYEATVKPAHSGFGLYEVGERVKMFDGEPEEATSEQDMLDGYHEMVGGNGYRAEPADDIDGRVQGQDGAKIYRLFDTTTDEEYGVFAVWVE